MSRKSYNKIEKLLPDPKYKSLLVSKFVNNMMYHGKKSVAERVFYSAMNIVGDKTNEDPMEVFNKAFQNVKPTVEVKSRRVGGATYQVPVEIRPERRDALAMRWMIQFSRKRGEKSMDQRLANEVLDAYKNTGASIKKKEETHRMAEANKAFAHFRW